MKSKLLLLVLLVQSAAFAVEDEVSVKFCAIAPGLAPLTSIFSSSGKEGAVEIPEGVRSSVQKYRGPSQTIFRDVAGQRMFPVVFPESSKLLLVILRLGTDGEPTSMVVEDDTDAVPPGSLSLINISNEPLKADAGEESADLEPGGKAIFKLSGRRTVFVRISDPATGNILLSNNWALASGARTLAILGSGTAESPGVRVYRFSDTSPSNK